MSSALVWIPLLAILAWTLRYQALNRWTFGPISWVLLIYLVMGAIAVVLDDLGHAGAAYPLELEPMLFLSACLLLGFWGLDPMRDRRLREIEIENLRVFRAFENFLIASSFIAIAFFLPFTARALSGDINFNRLDLEYGQTALGAWGYLNTFSSLAANLFVFNLVFAFLNMAPGAGDPRAARRRAVLLLVGSLSQLLYVLSYVGRDGVVFWAATFVFVYLMMRGFIPDRARRRVRNFAAVVLGLAFLPFAAITIARFAHADYGLLVAVLQYGGVQVQQFNDHYLSFLEPQWGQINFPLVHRLLPTGVEEFDRNVWMAEYLELGVLPYTFSTYVGTFVQDFGHWPTPLLVAAIALLTRASLRDLRTRGRLRVSQLLVFVLGAQVVMYGVFYFRQSMANSYVLAVLLLALAMKLTRRRSAQRIIRRDPPAAP